jgi:hypothetical protein
MAAKIYLGLILLSNYIYLSPYSHLLLDLRLKKMSVWGKWVKMLCCLFPPCSCTVSIQPPVPDYCHYLFLYLVYWGERPNLTYGTLEFRPGAQKLNIIIAIIMRPFFL